MKIAKKMFEELGYELIGYGERWIVYEKEANGGFLTIRFHVEIKTISTSFNFISSDELSAIHQQMKELGWIK